MTQPSIQQSLAQALQLHQAGRLPEAENIYRQILTRQPDHFDVLYNLGILTQQLGKTDDSLGFIRRAITIKPGFAAAHFSLANVLNDRGQIDDAISAYERALALNPRFAPAHNNLANLLKKKGKLDQAISNYKQAIALQPQYVEAIYNLGSMLKEKGELDGAIAAFRQAIAINPDLPEAHNNLGNALRIAGELTQAIAAYRQAVSIKPSFAGAHVNLGAVLREQGEIDDSITACKQAIALEPDLSEAHHNFSLALLTCGDFQAGWKEYEWRWKWKDFPSPSRNFPQPRWDGSPLKGGRVLLHAEQGFGDAIQFIRYAPLVAQRGGNVIVESQPELQQLFRSCAGITEIVTPGEPLPSFDCHCPLLSLPLVFETTIEAIPKAVPYLHAEPGLIDKWRKKIGATDQHIKVALVWSGNPQFSADRTRSMNLQQLAPLAALHDVKFCSLQKGPAEQQIKNPPPGLELTDLGPALNNFADTAAAISLMDLVLTTDSAVAHLAGAMGRRVWVMLQFVPDFRWLLEREDSPWYPTMRLFRQRTAGNWPEVVENVARELNALSSQRSTNNPNPGNNPQADVALDR